MSRQSQHHADLQKIRSDEACDFLLTNANFINWYRDPNLQRLVVVGEMGSGKTVAMTFLVDELRRRNEHQIPRPKVCCYYCRDDGTGQSIYILSALILSLLTQLPGLKKPFFQWYQEVQASGILYPAADIQKLEEFLQKVLEAVDRPVFIVIDGLDECDQASRNNLLMLLEALTQKIPGLKTILSTRPQEEILEQLDNTARIDMVSDVRRDSIVVEKTVETRLFYLSTDVKALVIERLSRLAQGSAIWTKMIVELIAAEKIRALEPMRSFLAEAPVPEQLSQLYVTLLSRCTLNVPKNLGLARTALKLLAITHRPLSILELSWAATLGTAAQDVTTVAALAQLVDHQKVMSLIHPFIARVDFSDVKKRQVRIIHQSVKEFILKEWTFPEDDDMILDQQRVESLEGFVLNICIRYLLLEEIGNKKLFSEEQFAIAELPQEFDLFSDDEEPVEYDPYCSWETWEEDMIRYDPTERGFGEFFVYASCYWLEHFGVVTVEPLPSLASIENLCRAGSTQLFNWTQQNCRPDCAITPRFPFESNLYDPLSITSLYGSEAMLRYMLANSDFDKGSFLSEAAFGAGEQVIQWGAASKLRILFLDEKLGYQLQTLDFFRLLVKSWSYPNANHHDWDVIFDLVNYVLGKLVEEKWGNDLLCLAAGAGCMPIIRRLMASAQGKADLRRELLREFRIEEEWSEFDKPMHQSIGEAVLGNHVDVVEYLLGENGIEAHLRYRNIHGENVLHLAARLCNPDMFRLLIPRFQEGIHQTDNQGDTALGRVITNSLASGDRLESARTLLSQSGVDWGKHSWDEQRDPLRVAVRLGDFDMCYLLLSIGEMNPLSALDCDSNGQIMGLKDITSENEANMQQILQLLCTHAKVATGSIRDE
jgi:NACHT domain